MSSECSEPWPTKTKLRVADEILTFLEGAAFENEQIDMAMAAMGIAGNLKKEENVIVAREVGATSVQAGLGQATCQGPSAWEFKVHGEILGRRLTWNMSFAKKRETRTAAALECVANVGRFLDCASQRQLKKCNVFKETVQGAILSGLCAFAGQNGSFTKNGLFPLKACLKRLAHRLFAMRRRAWTVSPNK